MSPLLSVIDFFKEVRVELAKVVWPSRSQTIQLTTVVIIVTLVVGFFVGGLDYLLAKGTQLLLSQNRAAQVQTIPATPQQQLPIQVQPSGQPQQAPTGGQQTPPQGEQKQQAPAAPQQ